MTRILFLLCICFLSSFAKAQDLNCRVQVLSANIQVTNKQIFETLETAIYDFLNTRKWTTDIIQIQERIDFNLIINITEWDGSNKFNATAQIISTRPVYNTSYNTPILNLSDKDWRFTYTESEALEINETGNRNNLTSMLAFYAYFVIGLDYDTYSPLGGTPYFQKAQSILNDAQNLSENGWKAFEDTRNRYWMVENVTNPSFRPYRQALYQYHRLGLDRMNDKMDEGRKAIVECLPLLKKVFSAQPGAFMLQLFFTSKVDEMVNIFSKINPSEKGKIIEQLIELNPANGSKYQKILTAN